MPTAAELKAQLDARSEELDRREAALTARAEQLDDTQRRQDERDLKLDQLATEVSEHAERLTEREQALTEREAAFDQRKLSEHEINAVFADSLTAPSDGNGYVIIEAPLPLVGVFANLHPSERGTIAAQMAAAMQQTLRETGKLRQHRDEDTDHPNIAIVTA